MSFQDEETEFLASGTLHLDNKSIIAHSVDLRHPQIQKGLENNYFEPVRSAELYGILRYRPVREIIISVTDPLYICTVLDDPQHDDYFKIDWVEYTNFLVQYISQPLRLRVDWRREGF